MKRNHFKKVIVILVIISLLYFVYSYKYQIKHLNRDIRISEVRILNYYKNFNPIEFLVKEFEKNPSKYNLKIFFYEINHQQCDIEALIELNISNASDEVKYSYINDLQHSKADTYIYNLALKDEEITGEELIKVKKIMNEWENFEDWMDYNTSLNIKDIDEFIASYIQLQRNLSQIMEE